MAEYFFRSYSGSWRFRFAAKQRPQTGKDSVSSFESGFRTKQVVKKKEDYFKVKLVIELIYEI